MSPVRLSADHPTRPPSRVQGTRARLDQWGLSTHRSTLPGVAWLLVSRLAMLYVILVTYSWFRKTYFQRPDEIAYANALDVINLQRQLGMAVTAVEIPLQQWVLGHPDLVDFFNTYYRSLKPGLFLSAGLCLLLAPAAFRRTGIAFLFATLIAFPWYAVYPLAPPRLMAPFGFDFIDTLAVYEGVRSSSTGAGGANQFAAMPSMHIGWTAVAALWLAAALPRYRIGATLGVIHLLLMSITVIVTGNHYTLDIIGGLLVAGGAVLLARSLPSPWGSATRSQVESTSWHWPGKEKHAGETSSSRLQEG